MGALEKTVVVRQFSQLIRRCLYEFLSSITRVYTPEAGHAIHYPIVVRVKNIDAIGPLNNAAFLLTKLLMIRERMEIMVPIEFLPILC